MPEITSRQHPIVRTFKSVALGDNERALIDGWHLLHEAVAAGVDVDVVAFAGTPGATDAGLIGLLARSRGTQVLSVSSSVMDALSPVRTPSGVVALVRRSRRTLADLLQPPPALVLVAIDLQDPGNAGALVRSADAGGATGAMFAGAAADPWGWKGLRAAMGSTFRLPIVQHANARAACEMLRDAGCRLVATVRGADRSMYDADLRRPTALLLGNEGAGLPDTLVALADERLSIPMQSSVESLNVAVAAGVLVYEARRQRR